MSRERRCYERCIVRLRALVAEESRCLCLESGIGKRTRRSPSLWCVKTGRLAQDSLTPHSGLVTHWPCRAVTGHPRCSADPGSDSSLRTTMRAGLETQKLVTLLSPTARGYPPASKPPERERAELPHRYRRAVPYDLSVRRRSPAYCGTRRIQRDLRRDVRRQIISNVCLSGRTHSRAPGAARTCDTAAHGATGAARSRTATAVLSRHGGARRRTARAGHVGVHVPPDGCAVWKLDSFTQQVCKAAWHFRTGRIR